MRQFLIVSLFIILLGDLMLGFGLGLAPGLSLKNAFLYILFIALVLDVTIGGRDLFPETWRFIGVWVALIAYAMFTWLAVSLLGIHRGYSLIGGFISFKNQLVDFFLFFLLFFYGPRSLAQSLTLAKWLIAAFAISNLVTLLDVFNIPDIGIMEDRRDSRITGPIGSVNQYGSVLAFIIPLTVGVALTTKGIVRIFYISAALIALILLGLTVSRGAFVGLFMGIVVTLIVTRRYYSRKTLIRGIIYSLVALSVVTAAVAIHDLEAFTQRFDFSEATSARDISSGRTDTWQRALTMMTYEPISFVTGYGWDSYRTLFLGYGDPHNEYLLFLFNLGIIGLSMFLYVLYWVFNQIFKSISFADGEIKPFLMGFLIGWIGVLTSVFFVGLYLPWLFIWACAGTFVRIAVEVRRKVNAERAGAEPKTYAYA